MPLDLKKYPTESSMSILGKQWTYKDEEGREHLLSNSKFVFPNKIEEGKVPSFDYYVGGQGAKNPVGILSSDVSTTDWGKEMSNIPLKDYIKTIYNLAEKEHGTAYADSLSANVYSDLFQGTTVADAFIRLMDNKKIVAYTTEQVKRNDKNVTGYHKGHHKNRGKIEFTANPNDYSDNLNWNTPDYIRNVILARNQSETPDTLMLDEVELKGNRNPRNWQGGFHGSGLMLHELMHMANPHRDYEGEGQGPSVYKSTGQMYDDQKHIFESLIRKYNP